MRYKYSRRALQLIFAGIAVAGCAIFLMAGMTRSASISDEERERTGAEQVHAYVRAGLGSEVTLATERAGPDEVRASIRSVAAFIGERAGFNLDEPVSDRLAKMEERTLNGERRPITADDLGLLFLDAVTERIRALSDLELRQAADGFANVKVFSSNSQSDAQNPADHALSPARSSGLPDKIMLRSSGEGVMSREDFIEQAEHLRTNLQSGSTRVAIMVLVRQQIARLITERLDEFAAALPGQWDRARRAGLTPVQAFLLVYSAASDDRLWYSNAELRQMMKASESYLREATGVTVSSEGRPAYGGGGYIFSTPLALVLDRQTIARILDLIEERSTK